MSNLYSPQRRARGRSGRQLGRVAPREHRHHALRPAQPHPAGEAAEVASLGAARHACAGPAQHRHQAQAEEAALRRLGHQLGCAGSQTHSQGYQTTFQVSSPPPQPHSNNTMTKLSSSWLHLPRNKYLSTPQFRNNRSLSLPSAGFQKSIIFGLQENPGSSQGRKYQSK